MYVIVEPQISSSPSLFDRALVGEGSLVGGVV